jgi:hypothetical protein
MKVSVEYDISGQQIADLMITVIESSPFTREWCEGVFLKRAKAHSGEGLWYADPKLYDGDFVIEVIEVTDESLDAPEGRCTHRITAHGMRLGIARMATIARAHFADWLNDEADGTTGDIFLQCVTLGEERYG